MRRQLGGLILGTSLLLSMPAYAKSMQLTYDGKVHHYDYPAISLYINNQKIETTVMEPVSIDGRVLVPAREVFEPLGASVQWDAAAKKVIIDYKQSTMILTANETDVWLDDKIVQLDVPAKIINDKVMIPIRFVSETMGFDVNWINSTYSVYISDGKQSGDSGNIKDENTSKDEVEDEKVTLTPPTYIAGKIVGQSYIGGSNIHQLAIPSKSYAAADVNSVSVTEANNKVTATINLGSALSDAEISVDNGKVIVDIKNSKSNLQWTITPNSNTYVERIRTSQFTSDTTRIVFDLKSGAAVGAYLTNNRQSLVLEMQKQNVEEITVGASSTQDTVYFKGLFKDQIIVNEGNGTITFQIKNAYLSEAMTLKNMVTNYIERMTLVPSGNGLIGTIYLNDEASCSVSSSTKGTTLTLSKVKETNIAYEADGSIYLSKESGITQSKLSFTDNYRERQIIVDLGGDYSGYFESGTLSIGDQKVTSIEVTNAGTTKLIVKTPTVKAFNVSETNGRVRIQFVQPSEKYDRIIVIDPGHGGSDSGAVGNGLKEKELNYKHALAVYNLLVQKTDIKVYMTRESDVFPSLAFRTQLANEIDADLFVSFHNNSGAASANGTETLYYPSTNNTMSQQMAQVVQNNIIKYCGTTNRGIKPRADLYVLRTSNMPAILIETGFISNQTEANLINSQEFINKFGQAVYEGILSSFEMLS